MGLQYFFFYAEANIVCIVILAILLINDMIHSTRQEKQLWFNRTIIAHILYFISDIGWAAVLSGHLPRTRFLVVLFNLINYVLLSAIAYEWFMYMASSEKMEFRNSRKKRILFLIPIILSVVVIVAAYLAAPYFWVDEDVALNDWYYPLMVAAPSFYLLTAFIFSAKPVTPSGVCRLIYGLCSLLLPVFYHAVPFPVHEKKAGPKTGLSVRNSFYFTGTYTCSARAARSRPSTSAASTESE